MKIPRLRDIKKVAEETESYVSQPTSDYTLLDSKIKELVQVIEQTNVDIDHSRACEQRIADAFKRSAITQKQIAPFQALDQDNNLSREELLEGLEKLLAENKIDSKMANRLPRRHFLQKGVLFLLAVLLIVFGFAMIIMPAPPDFEILTVFYFNANDGVTVMDLVSLLIIFGGVLLFVLNFNKK
ncbi:hypothetical protein [Dyadobacter pollutisoli]|uniref:Uncharacterized protein n=1 Tax=Dyadobacter pollutisoli TaxID=2910158 RepID=A0A9E8NBJ9_9BACT|nr:hypothetical protein [Dyadobacter pollutisoli]WAC13630.1 hypothetical protein ON006_06665 [Dyadobacter pollutisoli]